MNKSQSKLLTHRKEQEVIDALVYKGKIAAMKLYMEFTGCRLGEAKQAVNKLGQDIEPGPASA